MNVDQLTSEMTNGAMEIVTQGTKLSNELILFILKNAIDTLQNENSRDKVYLDKDTKEGRQKINSLIKKHKNGIESLEGNLTKQQLNDYQKELKKLGVDFSVVKNGRDNYSFFFAAEQAGIIEKAMQNVLEQKSLVLNDQQVKDSTLELNFEKSKFDEKEIDNIKGIYDKISDRDSISEEGKEHLKSEFKKLGLENYERNFENVSITSNEKTQNIHLKQEGNTWGDGDLRIEIDKQTGKANIFENTIDGENWSKSEEKLIKSDIELKLKENHLAKAKVQDQPEFENLNNKEKQLIEKYQNLDEIEKLVHEKVSEAFKEFKGKDISIEQINNTLNSDINIDEKQNEKKIEPTIKDESKEILQKRLASLDGKELELFTQRMEYENQATSPVFNSTQTYLEAEKLTNMQKNFSEPQIKKINNLDRDIRNLNNFDNKDNPKLTAKEILQETKEFNREKNKERDSKEKVYSIDSVKKKDKEIKAEDKNKPVVKNKEQSR